jgi:hypothetical protein
MATRKEIERRIERAEQERGPRRIETLLDMVIHGSAVEAWLAGEGPAPPEVEFSPEMVSLSEKLREIRAQQELEEPGHLIQTGEEARGFISPGGQGAVTPPRPPLTDPGEEGPVRETASEGRPPEGKGESDYFEEMLFDD